MAGIKATGKGSKLYVANNGVFYLNDVVANLTSIGEIGADVDEVEVTDLDSGEYKEFIPSLKDAGSLEISGNIVKDGTGYSTLKGLLDSLTIEEFGIEHPTLTEANVKFKAYVSSLKIGERTVDGAMTFSASLRISGAISDFTPPSE